MSAWFALVEGRYEDVVTAARMGQAAAGNPVPWSNSLCKRPADWLASVTAAKPTRP
ncbi:hypothetical protein SAMN05216276_105648 [Streptosporangium subroseum]|uniref:Uncharacterized protein n=2 Tax=Streptosporangium subroseum TaxID=106412 RepID=A0A239NG70_9ACTN|nr:hypothetical protein SAMN05216276_105648 [Streptosporangium subroseum]